LRIFCCHPKSIRFRRQAFHLFIVHYPVQNSSEKTEF
jgi:hypothetical protein